MGNWENLQQQANSVGSKRRPVIKKEISNVGSTKESGTETRLPGGHAFRSGSPSAPVAPAPLGLGDIGVVTATCWKNSDACNFKQGLKMAGTLTPRRCCPWAGLPQGGGFGGGLGRRTPCRAERV